MGHELFVRWFAAVVGLAVVVPLGLLWIVWLFRRWRDGGGPGG
jgi:hypothetical protein